MFADRHLGPRRRGADGATEMGSWLRGHDAGGIGFSRTGGFGEKRKAVWRSSNGRFAPMSVVRGRGLSTPEQTYPGDRETVAMSGLLPVRFRVRMRGNRTFGSRSRPSEAESRMDGKTGLLTFEDHRLRRQPLFPALDHAGAVRQPLSAALSIAAMMRCTATASSKLGAVRVPSRRSRAILA